MTRALTRRRLVTAAPAAVVAAAVPAIAGAHLDTDLLALREAFDRTWKAYTAALAVHSGAEAAAWRKRRETPDAAAEAALTSAEERLDRTERANRRVVERICEIPARTIEGLAFKAKVSQEHEDNRFEELVTSVMDDLLAMGGAHA